MKATITITFNVEDEDDGETKIREALEELAYVMEIQAEDGLYSGGYEDAEEPNEFVANISRIRHRVVLEG